MTTHRYNPFAASDASFMPSRLIFFADGDGKKTKSEKPTAEKKKSPRTAEQEIMLKKLHLENFNLHLDFDSEDLKEFFELFDDNDKLRKLEDKDSPYTHLIENLQKGKIKNAKTATRFMKAILAGGREERKYAKETLKELRQADVIPKHEDHYIDDLNAKRKKDEENIETATHSETEKAAKPTAENAKGAAESILNVAEKQKTPVFIPDKFPKEESEAIRDMQLEIGTLAKEFNALTREVEALYPLFDDKSMSKEKRAELKEKIEEIEKNLEEREKTIEEKTKKMQIKLNKLSDFFTKSAGQFSAIKQAAKKLGIDISQIDRLEYWMMDPAIFNDKAEESFEAKLGGLSGAPSGATEKKKGDIAIEKIYFKYPDEEYGKRPQSDRVAEADAGLMMIDYVDGEGHRATSTVRDFLDFINAYEGYAKLDSLKALNEEIAENNYYRDLAPGQEFKTEVLVDVDENGNEKYSTATFKIEKVVDKGPDSKIILDKVVVKTPKGELLPKLDPALYFDRLQKEFSPGEFARFVKQYGYRRALPKDLSPEEIDYILEADAAHKRKKIAEFGKDLPEDKKKLYDAATKDLGKKFELPKKEDEKKAVKFRSEDEPAHKGGSLKFEKAGNSGKYVLRLNPKPVLGDQDAIDNKKTPQFTEQPAVELSGPELVDLVMGDSLLNSVEKEIEKEAEKAVEKAAEKAVENIPEDGEEPANFAKSAIDPSDPSHWPYIKDYKEVENLGQPTSEKMGYFRVLWARTTMLSPYNVYELCKEIYEYYTAKWKRKQRHKIGSVGQNLPQGYGAHMKQIAQQAENEETDKWKGWLEQADVREVEQTLCTTNDPDVMKACFEVLTHKGHIRWDDINMWRNLNRMVDKRVGDDSKKVKIPANGDPYTKIDPILNLYGWDYVGEAVDAIWGASTYDEWYNSNRSNYKSHVEHFEDKANKLNNVSGGHKKVLEHMLQRHKRGEYVDPHEFEGHITQSIKAGKSSSDVKIYYLMAGLTVKNPHGHTILDFERVGSLSFNLANNFPVYEWFAKAMDRYKRDKDGNIIRDKNGKIETKDHNITIHDLEKIFADIDKSAEDISNPEENLSKRMQATNVFAYKYMLTNDDVHKRIEKTTRQAQEMDHDDTYLYIPFATESLIENICKSYSGSRKFLSFPGYCNVFPGFGEAIANFANWPEHTDQLAELIISYIRFDSILRGRFDKKNTKDYARLDDALIEKKGTVMTPNKEPIKFITSLNKAIKKVVNAYAEKYKGNEVADSMVKMTNLAIDGTESGEGSQEDVQSALSDFGKMFRKMKQLDEGHMMREMLAEMVKNKEIERMSD